MKKTLLIMLVIAIPQIVISQVLKGSVSYADILKEAAQLPDYGAKVEIYKSDSATTQLYIDYASTFIYFKDYWRRLERYNYAKAAYGKRSEFAQYCKKAIEKDNVTKELLDSLSAKCRYAAGQLEIHMPANLITEVIVNPLGEYSVKLPVGKYFVLVDSKNTIFRAFTYIEVKSENLDVVENFDF